MQLSETITGWLEAAGPGPWMIRVFRGVFGTLGAKFALQRMRDRTTLDFFVYCFSWTTAWEAFPGVRQHIVLKVPTIIHGRGADVAFPTTTAQPAPGDAPPSGAVPEPA